MIKYACLLFLFVNGAYVQPAEIFHLENMKGVSQCIIKDSTPFNALSTVDIHYFNQQGNDSCSRLFTPYFGSEKIQGFNEFKYNDGRLVLATNYTGPYSPWGIKKDYEHAYVYKDGKLKRETIEYYDKDEVLPKRRIYYKGNRLESYNYGPKRIERHLFRRDTVGAWYRWTDSAVIIKHYSHGRVNETDTCKLDGHGSVVLGISVDVKGTCTDSIVYHYVYDNNGRPIAEEIAPWKQRHGEVESKSWTRNAMTYDSDGRILERRSYAGAELYHIQQFNYVMR